MRRRWDRSGVRYQRCYCNQRSCFFSGPDFNARRQCGEEEIGQGLGFGGGTGEKKGVLLKLYCHVQLDTFSTELYSSSHEACVRTESALSHQAYYIRIIMQIAPKTIKNIEVDVHGESEFDQFWGREASTLSNSICEASVPFTPIHSRHPRILW